MPNNINYQTDLGTEVQIRPSRIAPPDSQIIASGSINATFGTHASDAVQIAVYDGSNTLVSQFRVLVGDSALTLTTILDDTTGQHVEFLNIDFAQLFARANLAPSRYTLAINFLKSEVGSPETYMLYISDISTSRTEIKIKPLAEITDSITKNIFEFVDPSISKLAAQGLIDDIFGVSINPNSADVATPEKIIAVLSDMTNTDVNAELNYIGVSDSFTSFISGSLGMIRQTTLNLMAADVDNPNIQKQDLLGYISQATTTVLTDLTNKKQLDDRVELV